LLKLLGEDGRLGLAVLGLKLSLKGSFSEKFGCRD
jgi:hypothetical protein